MSDVSRKIEQKLQGRKKLYALINYFRHYVLRIIMGGKTLLLGMTFLLQTRGRRVKLWMLLRSFVRRSVILSPMSYTFDELFRK